MSNIQGTDGWHKSADRKEILERIGDLTISGGDWDDGDTKAIQACSGVGTINVQGITKKGRRLVLDDFVPDELLANNPSALTSLTVASITGLSGNADLAPDVSWEVLEDLAVINFSNSGLTAAEVDAILIGLAAAGAGSPGLGSGDATSINLAGNNAARTSASDAAVTALEAIGYTVTTTS